jgi:3-oxoacyl-[acyl-carrier-protein] synthase-1
MRRAVITGLGAVSCIGNNKEEILDSLKNGRSGIVANEMFKEMGLRSQVSGSCEIDFKEHIDRKVLRFMGDAAAYAYVAMQQCISDAGLEDSDVSNVRSGLIAGSGGASSANIVKAADTLRARGVRKIGPYGVTKFAGGGEEEDWTLTALFDAMGALSTKYNDDPTQASRPYDAGRDGFVSSSGSGMVVVEEFEHAKARGAKIYAELVGYAATSDGYDMVAPSGEGAIRCMNLARSTVELPIDYINTHGTSTPVGDVQEVQAMRELFGDDLPRFASTKSMCGHSLGATGVQEAIHCLLMLEHDFIAPSINVVEPDEAIAGAPLVTELVENAGLRTAMSNSFGFGGTNGTLVFQKP